MDASQFDAALGLLEDSQEVIQLLKDLGVTTKLKLGPEGYTKLELLEKGVELAFVPAESKSSLLRFDSVRFYTAQDDFSEFSGQLPRGLKFSDTQTEVRGKLGTPTQSIDKYRLDNYRWPDRFASVKYRKAGSIAHLLWSLPEPTDQSP
jgi:hypothetical protein